jgi:hypothetical protein
MLGWTSVLLSADRRPLERRGVLLLTMCLVSLGLAGTEVVGVAMGSLNRTAVAPTAGLRAGRVGAGPGELRASQRGVSGSMTDGPG